MADGIKKVVLKKESLPPIGPDNEYQIRYRIISEDRNRASFWSPIFRLQGEDVVESVGSVSVSGDITFAVWNDEQENPGYDVFVVPVNEADEEQAPVYIASPTTKNFLFWNNAYSKFKLEIQKASRRRRWDPRFRIFKSDTTVL
jgi:hypothetical protein